MGFQLLDHLVGRGRPFAFVDRVHEIPLLAYHRLTGLWSWLLLGKERCGSFGVTAIYNIYIYMYVHVYTYMGTVYYMSLSACFV